MSQRNLGVIFADISGTTQLHRKIGTSEAQRALERCMRRIERAVESHHGDLLMPAVDEIIAVFPGADDALAAAVEMQQKLADLPPTSGINLSIRVGVHFGVDDVHPDELRGATMDAGRALLNVAGPHQIVLCAETAAALSPPQRRCLHSLDGVMIGTAEGDSQLYEFEWAQPAETVQEAPTIAPAGRAPAAPADAPRERSTPSAPNLRPLPERICIRIHGKAYLVDERTPSLTIGRDKSCDVVIRDRKASRMHVRLERRGRNRFFLVDESTNGTYVAIGKGQELKLHNEEMQISGRGRLAFGHSGSSEDAELADFEAL